jgi:hypothetical protein
MSSYNNMMAGRENFGGARDLVGIDQILSISMDYIRPIANFSNVWCNFITMDYQPVLVKAHRQPPGSTHSAESRYWRQFKHPVFVKEYAPITSVHFSPSRPHRYAVTAATRVQIYAPRTQKLTKTISRFKDVARSGCIREDGKLVVAGDDSGLIQVCNYMHLRNCVLSKC